MKTILFQGDSITDAGRSYERDDILGYGYANLATATLGMEYPREYRFYNRGISGNRVIDLLARIKRDIINLKPDYMSILIGVNDVWHGFDENGIYNLNGNGVDSDLYETYYCMMIEQIKKALPNIRIMILEPFVLHGTGTSKTEEHWTIFRSEVEARAAAAKRIAEQYNLVFVPLQELFDKAYETADMGYWLGDGVHPTAAGHELIKREWLKGFEKLT